MSEIARSLVQQVRDSQLRTYVAANHELMMLSWTIGRAILDNTETQGEDLVEELAQALRDAYPTMVLFAPRHFRFMRAVAETWPRQSDFEQSPASQLPWDHLVTLLEEVDAPVERERWATKTVVGSWSLEMLRQELSIRRP